MYVRRNINECDLTCTKIDTISFVPRFITCWKILKLLQILQKHKNTKNTHKTDVALSVIFVTP